MLRRASLALAMFVALAAPLAAQDPLAKPADVDLVICLDVSSSMNGLINQAKSKLWGVVNELANAKPTPNLRVALYSYGHSTYDRTTGWVRKELDFTRDLDQVNDKLFGLRTGGGTELVARVTKAALEQLAWSRDTKALKIIFVCGNESANQDTENSTKSIAEKAVRQGVAINTIFCGPENSGISTGWREFALLAEGRYASINQDKTVATVATPYDKQIAELGGKLGETYVFFGGQRKALAENQKKQDAAVEKLGASAVAERAVTKANGLYRFQEDLVEKAQRKEKLDLDKVADADLPEALKNVAPAERERHLNELAAKRTAIQAEILKLNQQREKFLRDQTRPNAPGAAGLDDALRGAIREQAKGKGINLEK